MLCTTSHFAQDLRTCIDVACSCCFLRCALCQHVLSTEIAQVSLTLITLVLYLLERIHGLLNVVSGKLLSYHVRLKAWL